MQISGSKVPAKEKKGKKNKRYAFGLTPSLAQNPRGKKRKITRHWQTFNGLCISILRPGDTRSKIVTPY